MRFLPGCRICNAPVIVRRRPQRLETRATVNPAAGGKLCVEAQSASLFVCVTDLKGELSSARRGAELRGRGELLSDCPYDEPRCCLADHCLW
jgi:hypothetical protein